MRLLHIIGNLQFLQIQVVLHQRNLFIHLTHIITVNVHIVRNFFLLLGRFLSFPPMGFPSTIDWDPLL